MKENLDFIIIGAMKAGTTSLFEYLRGHPQIYMPSEKECPYFTDDNRIVQGWRSYLGSFFRDAPPDVMWGTTTPDYMIHPDAPQRIGQQLPNVKLIAIVRNPIDRAYSHYRMMVRRGDESRVWEDAIHEQMIPANLEFARRYPDQTNSYVVNGEYVRILTSYYELFPRSQIYIVSSEQMLENPSSVISDILRFLDIRSDFKPANLGRVYHQGGMRQRLNLVQLRHNSLLRFVWRKMLLRKLFFQLSEERRRSLSFWFDLWNVIPESGDCRSSLDVYKALITHFDREVRMLPRLTQSSIHWNEWHA